MNPQLIVAIAVAVVVVIGVAAFAISQSGKDDGPSKTKQSGNTTSIPNGSGTGPSVPGSTPATNGGGSEDLTKRAENVAGQTFLLAGVDSSTVSCLSDGFVADPALLAVVEPVASSVVLESPDDASRYASLVMGCASPQEVGTEIVQGLANSGQFDQVSLNCIDAALSGYGSGDWVEFLTAAVQSARANEVQSVLSDAVTYC